VNRVFPSFKMHGMTVPECNRSDSRVHEFSMTSRNLRRELLTGFARKAVHLIDKRIMKDTNSSMLTVHRISTLLLLNTVPLSLRFRRYAIHLGHLQHQREDRPPNTQAVEGRNTREVSLLVCIHMLFQGFIRSSYQH